MHYLHLHMILKKQNFQVYQWKLLNHVAKDHNKTLKPAHLSYKCTVCTATFGQYKLFETHVYTAHSGVAKKADKAKQVGRNFWFAKHLYNRPLPSYLQHDLHLFWPHFVASHFYLFSLLFRNHNVTATHYSMGGHHSIFSGRWKAWVCNEARGQAGSPTLASSQETREEGK